MTVNSRTKTPEEIVFETVNQAPPLPSDIVELGAKTPPDLEAQILDEQGNTIGPIKEDPILSKKKKNFKGVNDAASWLANFLAREKKIKQAAKKYG